MADDQVQPTTSDSTETQVTPAEVQSSTGDQPSPQNGQAPPDTSNLPVSGQTPIQPPQPADPRDSHPAVQQAGIMRRIGETIAGGPRIKTTIDPNTGVVTREKQPLDTKDILVGALANILGGFGQVASNASARQAGRSPAPIQPLPTQVAQQKQAQQSQADFEQEQQTKIQKAKVLQANMEAMRSAYAAGKEDDEAKDSIVSNHSDDLENWKNSGAVEASNIPSNELMQKGFDKTKYVAIPDGKVPVFGPNGQRATDNNGVPLSQLTYSVVDGTTQTPLTQAKYNQLAKYGLMSAKQGFNLPEGATITSASLALMNHKLDLIQQTQRELDDVHDQVGGDKVDLAEQIKKNPQVLSAIEKFHNDAASADPNDQIKSIQKNHPQAAGIMSELFGQENLEKLSNQKAADLAKAKEKGVTEGRLEAEGDKMDDNKAASILSDPKSTPQDKQRAQDFLKIKANTKFTDKEQEINAQRAIEDKDLSTAAKNIVSGNLAQIRDLVSFRGDQKTRVYNMIADEAKAQGKDPKDYSPAKLEAKTKVLNDFSDGKAADSIVSFNTFLGHANDALSATGAMRGQTGSPLINRPLNWIRKNAANDTNFQAFQTALVPVRKEYMSFLNNNRAEHEGDIKVMETVLNDDSTPAQIESALKKLGESGDIRLAELGRKYSNTMGDEYPSLLAPESKQALQRMGVQSRTVTSTKDKPVTPPKPAQNFAATSSDGKWGYDGKQWVATGK
jgi:hypothetical protein